LEITNGLVNYLNFCNDQLEEIVIMIRGELTPILRIIIEALIVTDVHCNFRFFFEINLIFLIIYSILFDSKRHCFKFDSTKS
jgi:hypothetical protein